VQDDLRRFKQLIETGEVVQSDASIHWHPILRSLRLASAEQPPAGKSGLRKVNRSRASHAGPRFGFLRLLKKGNVMKANCWFGRMMCGWKTCPTRKL